MFGHYFQRKANEQICIPCQIHVLTVQQKEQNRQAVVMSELGSTRKIPLPF